MKLHVFYIIFFTILISIGVTFLFKTKEREKEHTTITTNKIQYNINQKDLEFYDNPNIIVVTIDSCEYLYGPWGTGRVLTHKGNCKNKQHGK